MTSPRTLGIVAGALVAAAVLCAPPVAAQDEPAPTPVEAPANAPAEAAPEPDAPPIEWLQSYADALARASAEKKPILLYFHSPG